MSHERLFLDNSSDLNPYMVDHLQFSIEVLPSSLPSGVLLANSAVRRMQALGPDYISVTYGAGGGTHDASRRMALDIHAAGGRAVPHISCIGATRNGIKALLGDYKEAGIRHVVALRGDYVSGLNGVGEFQFAVDLVRFIRSEFGDWFHIDVAAYPERHPQSNSGQQDMGNLVEKIRAGADSAITQFFFNVDAYEDFMDRAIAHGLNVPIVPGVMPIGNFSRLFRFAEVRGIEIPRWIKGRVADFGDDHQSSKDFAKDLVIKLSRRLLEIGAPGLHFFSLNRAEQITDIWQQLNLPGYPKAAT